MSHTILLLQRSASENSRTYKEYDSVSKAMEGLVELFENQLKKGRSGNGPINYKLADLEAFVDSYTDFGVLVFKAKESLYEPKAKDWVKKQLEKHILNLAKKSQ